MFPQLRSPFFRNILAGVSGAPTTLNISVSDSITVSESRTIGAPAFEIYTYEEIRVFDGIHAIAPFSEFDAESNSFLAPLGGTAGSGQTEQAMAQSFTSIGTKLKSIRLLISALGTPTDNLVINITSSLGGSSLGTASYDVSTLDPDNDTHAELTFASPITLVNGNTYYIEFTRSGARDVDNAVWLDAVTNGFDVYTGGAQYRRDNNSWVSQGGAGDYYFIVVYDEGLKIELNSNINKSENITVSENSSMFTDKLYLSVSDSITVSESVKIENTLQVRTSDSITVTESTQFMMESYINKSDTVTLTESVALAVFQGGLAISVSDSITLTESTKFLMESYPSVSDSVSVSENIKVELNSDARTSDTITTSETTSLIVSDPQIAVSDSIATLDTASVALEIYVYASDTIATTESVAGLTSSPNTTTSDTVTVGEAIHVELNSDVLVSDTITVTDTPIVQTTISLTVQDSITVSENVGGVTSAPQITVSDTITVTDTPTVYRALIDFTVSVSDTITTTEDLVIQPPFFRQSPPKYIMDDLGNIYMLIVDKDTLPIYTLI